MKKALLIILAGLFLAAAGCAGRTATQNGDFNFILKYGITARNEINTFEGTYTKDLVLDGTVTIDLALTKAEMDSIYQKMLEIDFFSYPDEFKVTPGETTGFVTPYEKYYFKVEKGSLVKDLRWEDEILNPDVKADKLRELITLIINIIESKPEYKALPEIRGGYM